MKRITSKLLSIVLIICVLIPCTSAAYAVNQQSDNDNSIIAENYYMENYTGYDYPVLPRTRAWKSLKNHQEMVNACQIPYEVYHNMDTETLAQSIIAYPLNADMFAYDSFELGYTVVKEHFGALEELSNRPDGASCLIDLYSKQKLVNFEELDNETRKSFESDNGIVTTELGQKACRQIIRTLSIELLLSQNDFFNQMTVEDQNNLTRIIDSHIADTCQMQESEMLGSIRSGSPSYFIEIFFGYIGTNYYDGKIATGSTSIRTPKNGLMTGYTMEALEVWRYTDGYDYIRQLSDLSSSAKTSLNTEFYNIYSLNPISSPSVKYNCHSYAWYKQTNCNYWVATPNTTGYTLVDKLTVNVGGKMVYYGSNDGSYTTLTHSAVITDIEYYPRSKVSFTVKSKWGMCGLYEHLWYNCPYYYHDALGNSNPFPNDIKLYNS